MIEKIHILLPVHNRRDITRRFIECLKTQTFQNYQLILIDDGSTDGTEEMVRNHIKDLAVIKGQGHWWWGGSLHQGYLWLKSHGVAEEDLVLIANDDTEFDDDYLKKGVARIQRTVRSMVVSKCYSRMTGEPVDTGAYFFDLRKLTVREAANDQEVNCLSTRGLFLRAVDFCELGGFHPRLLPHYLSDMEFTIRAHRNGFRLLADPSIRVCIDEHTTGYHTFHADRGFPAIRKYFSKKSAANPASWSAFILLVCPWPWKLVNMLKIWISAAHFVFAQISPLAGTGEK